jgi:hypothetical protein
VYPSDTLSPLASVNDSDPYSYGFVTVAPAMVMAPLTVTVGPHYFYGLVESEAERNRRSREQIARAGVEIADIIRNICEGE